MGFGRKARGAPPGERRRRSLSDRPIPSGHIVAPPDFVGVGVQRAGTSWWFSLIAAHPGVHQPAGNPKELHYFDEFWGIPFTDEEASRYHRLFPRPPGLLAGEWTPRYLHDYWVLPLLRRAAPDTKILVALRDPVERLVSGIGIIGSEVTHPHVRAADAFPRGFYHRQLMELVKHFDRARVLVLQYERFREDPAGELATTYRFLGVDPDFAPPDIGKVVAVPTRRAVELSSDLRALLVERYRDDVERLASDFPEIEIARWPNFARG